MAFASLFRELSKVGCPPPVARRMFVWEAAAALGKTFDDDANPAQAVGASADHSLLHQRFLASQGLGDAPQPKATSQEELNAMMAMFG